MDTEDEMLQEALLDGSASGTLYRLIRRVKGDESIGHISGMTPQSRGKASGIESVEK